MTMSLAMEWGRYGIRLNTIAPGVVETPLPAQIKNNPAWYQAYADKSALKRWARADESLEAPDRYLDESGVAGLDNVLIIHGMGTGAVRDAVRAAVASHPLVKSLRPGQRGEGGDGATIVEF